MLAVETAPDLCGTTAQAGNTIADFRIFVLVADTGHASSGDPGHHHENKAGDPGGPLRGPMPPGHRPAQAECPRAEQRHRHDRIGHADLEALAQETGVNQRGADGECRHCGQLTSPSFAAGHQPLYRRRAAPDRDGPVDPEKPRFGTRERERPELSGVGLGARVVEPRSEEHTSELQSLAYLVCRLLLEKKKHNPNISMATANSPIIDMSSILACTNITNLTPSLSHIQCS